MKKCCICKHSVYSDIQISSDEDVRCKALRKPICTCVQKLKPRFCKEPHVSIKKGEVPDGENVVILRRALNTTCTVNLQGATITSWRLDNEEQLFVGKLSHYGPHHPIRGGISLAFPFCGEWSLGPRLGSSRKIRWRVLLPPEKLENGDVQAAFIVCDSAYTRSMWNNNFWLCFWIILQVSGLHLRYFVFNTNNVMPFEFTPLLMSTFRTRDVRQCVIGGLCDCEYTDDENAIIYKEEEHEELFIEESIHRLYCDTPDLVLEDCSSPRTISIIKDQPDTTIWNPWTGENSLLCFYTQVHEEVDFHPEDYQYMLRVACGHVRKPITLNPNEYYVGHLIIKVDQPREVIRRGAERTSRASRTSRVVPRLTKDKLTSYPQLPRLSSLLKPPRLRSSIRRSALTTPSLTDIPYIVAEELLMDATKKHKNHKNHKNLEN